ncbi:MAG: transposase [Bacteroidota bacterium]
MSDSLITGRSFRIFNLMDDFNREALCMRGNFSMLGIRVVEYIKDAIELYGKPNQNGYIERFNRTYREDVLDARLFRDIEEVNLETERFREEYNCFHSHKSLGRSSPKEYLEEFLKGHAPLKNQFV